MAPGGRDPSAPARPAPPSAPESATPGGAQGPARRWRRTRTTQAELRAREREELLAAVFDQSPVAVMRVRRRAGEAGEIIDANAAAGMLLGKPPAALVGTDIHEYLAERDRLPVRNQLERCEVRVIRPGGHRWAAATVSALDAEAGAGMALVVLQDITERKQAEEQLNRAASHDALTGLINRDELLRRIGELAAVPGGHVAVLFADLDGFKRVNDSRGHQVGDEILVAVARRIRAAIRPEDFVGRIGGDEFVIVCPRMVDPRHARSVAARVRATLNKPFTVSGRSHQLGVSIGISSARSEELDAVELLRRSDLAMYQAKETRAGIRFYEPEFDRALRAGERLREDLRAAVLGQGLRLHFQPVVEIETGRLRYLEALVRLAESDGSLVYPAEFIPVAEQSGLITVLGQRVLEGALGQREAWLAAGHEVAVGLNLSPAQLANPGFVSSVMAALAGFGAPAAALVFEISELGVVDASGPVQLALRRMRAAGIGLAIDHFGTGYSSLGALRYLGADRVKIDRSFVTSVAQSAEDRAVLSAAISVAHALGQRVIAEGVETIQQLLILAELGCDDVQGFLVAGAGPADNLDLGRPHWKVPGWPQPSPSRPGANPSGR